MSSLSSQTNPSTVLPSHPPRTEPSTDLPLSSASSGNNVSSSSSSSSSSLLDTFLPPEVPDECDESILQRFQYYYELTQNGHNFTDTLRSKKDFRNPYFLNDVINQYNLDPYGSNYPSRVYNPHAYQEHEYAKALLTQQAEEEQRRKQQQELRTSINFTHSGSIPGTIIVPSSSSSSSSSFVSSESSSATFSGASVSSSAYPKNTTGTTGSMESMIAEAVARSVAVANTMQTKDSSNSHPVTTMESLPRQENTTIVHSFVPSASSSSTIATATADNPSSQQPKRSRWEQ